MNVFKRYNRRRDVADEKIFFPKGSSFFNFMEILKTSQLMLYREIIALCSEIHTKQINTLCGQKVEFVNVKPGGTYSNH
jgi:hypothetical protein